MKFLVAFALIAAVVSAAILPLSPSQMVEVVQIHEAIHSASTNPPTTAALEQMLLDVLRPPIIASPILVPSKPEYQPIHIGPAIIEQPIPEIVVPEPIVVPEQIVAPQPAPVVIPTPASNTPLVQIILNINQADSAVVPEIIGGPVNIVEDAENHIVPEPIDIVEIAPEPIQIVEVAPALIQIVEVAPEPIQIVEVAPEPIQIVEVASEPVQIVNVAPVIIPESIQIAEPAPIVPSPIVHIPSIINH